jgi:hypothetical protein
MLRKVLSEFPEDMQTEAWHWIDVQQEFAEK